MPVNPCIEYWRQMPQREPDPKTVCNFCKQVIAEDNLIAGHGVNICNECVELCSEISTYRQRERIKGAITEIAALLRAKEQTLTNERAIVMATSILDTGYHKEGS